MDELGFFRGLGYDCKCGGTAHGGGSGKVGVNGGRMGWGTCVSEVVNEGEGRERICQRGWGLGKGAGYGEATPMPGAMIWAKV